MSIAINPRPDFHESTRTRGFHILHSSVPGTLPKSRPLAFCALAAPGPTTLHASADEGDHAALVHGLRGKPSNHRIDLGSPPQDSGRLSPRLRTTSDPPSPARSWPNRAWPSPRRHCGSWLLDRGAVAEAAATRPAPPAQAAALAASASWCRWIPPSTTGSRAVASRWYW